MTRREAKQSIAELDGSMDLVRMAVQVNPWLAISAFPLWCLGHLASGLLRLLLRYDWPWEPS